MLFKKIKDSWFFNVRGDILSGMTLALALIPEAIAFSIMAGVDPMVGLYASFTIAVSISIFGGRPGMISAATGAMASLMGPIIAKYGIEYLFVTTVLTGIIQLPYGSFKVRQIYYICAAFRYSRLCECVSHHYFYGAAAQFQR